MIKLSPRLEVSEFRKRYKWMALFVTAVFVLLAGRMVQLQIVDHDRWSAAAQENITKTVTLPATRGVVRDTRDRVIASNRPSYDVMITPKFLSGPSDLDTVGDLLGLSEATRQRLTARIDELPEYRRVQQIRAFSDISRDQLAVLETHQSQFHGIDVVTSPKRLYPYGKLGAHSIGYLNEVNRQDLERFGDTGHYRVGDRIGRSGIERAYEEELRGRRGFRRTVVDARGRAQHEPFVNVRREVFRKPEPGQDLVVTLDIELMEAIDRAFGPHPSGAAVVLDVHTGAVRALYSKPAYDANEMSGGMSSARYQELLADPFRPLIDKTIYETYFPGSTFKPVTALAALQEDVIQPFERLECEGYHQVGRQRFRCTGRHGDVNLHEAIVVSCNVYFWKLAEKIDLETFNRYAAAFGFGQESGIGINDEASGFLASKEWYVEKFGKFRPGYTLNTAIGQGNTRVTVLQLALAYAALANGGVLRKPSLVEHASGSAPTVDGELDSHVRRRLEIDEEHFETMRRALIGVVNSQKGTGYRARLRDGVRVAGKTGTAQVIGRGGPANVEGSAWYLDRSHGWFAGFAPAKDPQIAIAVLVEHGGAGGKTAAPIAVRILDTYLSRRK